MVATQAAPQRLLFIDNIRWTMILLVLSMHAVDTYSPFGNWYYTDRAQTPFTTALIFGIYQSVLQAFFMALLFFVSGSFAAPSYDRKGFTAFVHERLIRLGIPTLLYMLVVGPLTQYFLSRTWGTGGFAHQWRVHLTDGEVWSETGPMWFAAVLLLFSLLYASIRYASSRSGSGGVVVAQRAFPSGSVLVGFAALMAVTTFGVRIVIPENVAVVNVHPGDFPQYILMFSAGIWAHRGRWLQTLPKRWAMCWAAALLLPSVLLFAALLIFGGAAHGDTSLYPGGLNFVNFGKSVWESLVCVGASLAIIVLYRERFNEQGPISKLLAENAFAVYLFHPPVVICLAILMHGIPAPALLKAVLLTAAVAVAAYFLAALVLRRIPLLRRVV